MKQLFTSFFLLIFLNPYVFCQAESLEINESFKNTSLIEVFDILKSKYQLKIAFDHESVQEISITKNIHSTNLETALTTLFSDTDLEYQIVDQNRILIRKNQNYVQPSSSEKQTYTFQGNIFDTKNNTPLAFATIFCPATNEGTSSDENGNFSLTIHTTKVKGTLSIQYLGYIPRILQWKKGEDWSNLQINLQTKTLDFKEVTILEKPPILSVNQEDGAMLMRTDQLATLPSFVGGNDIFRSIQLLPGISASDDLSSELRIRGSNGDENMIILDGITLYKVDHYFGIFSAVNSNIINQAKVYKNAFPVEYGGRTAGVVDLSSHQIDEPKIGGILQADLLTSNAYLALPIGTKMGLLIGGRTTNKNVANTDLFDLLQTNRETTNAQNVPQITQGSPEFKFYDLNAKWLWKINAKSDIALSFFRGYDQFTYDYTRVDTTFIQRRNDKRKEQAINTENFEEKAEWNNRGASLQINHQWKPNLQTYANFAYSNYNDSQIINSTLNRKIERQRPPKPNHPPMPIKRDTTHYLTNTAYNSILGLEFNLKNQWEINPNQQLTFGYHLVKNEVEFKLDVDKIHPISKLRVGTQHAAYLQYDIKTEEKFNLNLGLRNTYYTITDKNYVSPRVNFSYKALETLKFKASFSKYHQFLRKNYREDRFGVAYEFWTLSEGIEGRFPISSSTQFMLGFNFFKNGFELDVEAYHKNIDGVTEFALRETGIPSDRVAPTQNLSYAIFNGSGISKGIDVLLKKSSGDYTSWLAYTLSKTTHSFPQISKGASFPSQDDRRHQIKWVNQYRFKQFDFSTTFIYSSGRPYTDLTKIPVKTDRKDINPNTRISYLPNYFRLDVAANYNFKLKNDTKGRLGLSLFNVLDRKNVKYRQYIYSIPNQRDPSKPNINEVRGTDLLMLGFTPNVSLSFEF